MDKRILALLEKVGANVEDLRSVTTTNTSAITDHQSEMEARFTKMDGRMTSIENGTKTKRKAIARGVISVPGLEDELDKFSWSRAIGAINTNDWKHAGFEKGVFDAAAERATNQSTNTQGGFLVPAELQAGIIEALTKRSVILRAGATWLQGLSGGNLEFNREDTVIDLAAQAEALSSAMSDSTPTLDQLTLSENAAGALVFVTRQMVRNANQSVDAWIETQMVKAIARYIDNMALTGSGSSNQPLGVMNDTALQSLSLGGSGNSLEFEDISEMTVMLEEENAWDDAGKMAMIWHPRVRHALRLQRVHNLASQTTNFDYLYGGRMNNLEPVLGFPEYASTQLNGSAGTADAILGNMEELILATWGNLEIERSDDYRFGHNQIAIRAVIGMDVGVRHDKSFVVVDDADITPQ